jgi:hypothetical protein
MHKCVNSFSAFGEKRHSYMALFPLIIRMHYTFYPNWKIRLTTDRFFDDSQPTYKYINNLINEELLELDIIDNNGTISQQPVKGIAMLWRMIPIWKDFDYVFTRDLDSILTPRQAKLVYAFVSSGKSIHGINDNASHSIPLMGGMIGIQCNKFKSLTGLQSFSQMINLWNIPVNEWDKHGKDQEFLMSFIWPKVQNDSLIHRIEGPNDRCNLKNPIAGFIPPCSEKILEEGDNFTNYIGASNCINTTYGAMTLEYMCNFYDTYGNLGIMQKIKKCETV